MPTARDGRRMGNVTFADRDRLARTQTHAVALDALAAGIEAAHPARLVADAVSVADGILRIDGVSSGEPATYDLDAFDRISLVGAGKAADGLAAAVVDALAGTAAVDAGTVVTTEADAAQTVPGVAVRPGDHPLPSERGVASARRVVDAAERAGADDLVLAAITGGGSALLAAPADPLSVADLRVTTDALLASGASIDEINAVRRHCSAVKGGRLARAAAPATVATLAVSDVVGDDLATIASGPTVPDPTTYADALAALDRHGVTVPDAVAEHLRVGAAGDRPETPAPGDPAFDRATAVVIGNGRTALDAAAAAAADRGFEPLVLASGVRGEASEAALTHVAVGEECAARGSPVEPPAVLLSGGETTVTLGEESGSGGPNAEFAASAGVALAASPSGFDGDAVVASVDTDGADGSTDAAGAVTDATTFRPGAAGEPDGSAVDDDAPDLAAARAALDRHDVAPLLERAGALLRTGPTGTNVDDLRVVAVGSPAADGG